MRLVLKGARLIGTNSDLTGPSEDGIIPACRAMIAPIEMATGQSAYFVGKPLSLIHIFLPLGVGAAIYLTEYAANRRLVSVIEFATETLTGIPSIIFGLVGMLLFVQRLGLKAGILAGGLTLVVMILPTIVRTTQELSLIHI